MLQQMYVRHIPGTQNRVADWLSRMELYFHSKVFTIFSIFVLFSFFFAQLVFGTNFRASAPLKA